jgi:hypothetical protein
MEGVRGLRISIKVEGVRGLRISIKVEGGKMVGIKGGGGLRIMLEEITSISILLNSSKHIHDPPCARPLNNLPIYIYIYIYTYIYYIYTYI